MLSVFRQIIPLQIQAPLDVDSLPPGPVFLSGFLSVLTVYLNTFHDAQLLRASSKKGFPDTTLEPLFCPSSTPSPGCRSWGRGRHVPSINEQVTWASEHVAGEASLWESCIEKGIFKLRS